MMNSESGRVLLLDILVISCSFSVGGINNLLGVLSNFCMDIVESYYLCIDCFVFSLFALFYRRLALRAELYKLLNARATPDCRHAIAWCNCLTPLSSFPVPLLSNG